VFGGKIIEAVGDKSRDLTDKLAEKYRAHVGEELLAREARLSQREAALDARERAVAEREAQLKRYLLLPKIYVQVPFALAILCAAVYLGYRALLPAAPAVGADNAAGTSCFDRGVAYYREIGSYPTLSNGENADRKIAGMCERSNMAFGR
jgi:hypothetical protein